MTIFAIKSINHKIFVLKFSNKISGFAIVVIYIVMIYARWIHLPDNPIIYDVFGYYLYLPFTFIYKDLGLQHKEVLDHLISQYHLTSGFYQAPVSPIGHRVMKYSMGMAVLYSPGFFVAHIIALLTSYPADGFSEPYQWALLVNSTLFAYLGLFMLRKVLFQFFTDRITTIVLVLIFFGTNYYVWSTTSAEMPHNYLFTLYAFVLWFTIRWHNTYKTKYIIYLSLVISLMALARPTEIIAIIIPLLWNVYNKETFAKKIALFKANRRQLLWFVLIMLFIGFIQMLYWKIHSGRFVYYSYINPGEGFEFLDPYTFKVLFSFRNGWLIYTPMMIFAILGFYFLYKANIKIFAALFLFFIINLYIISSWSCWWYAGGFGHRAFVQSYALMSLPLGYFIQYVFRKSIITKVIISTIFILLIVLNLFQAWQLRNSILSSNRMTYDYYVSSFGKTKVDYYKKAKLCLIDRSKSDSLTNESHYKKSILKTFDFEQVAKRSKYCTDSISYNGNYSYKIDSTIKFYSLLKIPYKDLTTSYYAWVRVNMFVYIDKDFANSSVKLAMFFSHKGKLYHHKSIDFAKLRKNGKIQPDRWNKIKMDYLTPEIRSKNDILNIQLLNRGKKSVYIDDISIELFEPVTANR